MATIFRGPVFARPIARRINRADVWPNLLVATLAVTAAAPFKPTPWQQSFQRIGQQAGIPPNLLCGTFSAVPSTSTPSWTDPSTLTYTRWHNRTEIPRSLLTTTLVSTQPPFVQDVWPQAYGEKWIGFDVPANMLARGIPAASAPAFSFCDIPAQVRGRGALLVDVPPNMLIRGIPAAVPPFNLTDWTRLYPRALVRVPDPPNLPVSTLAPSVGTPFSQCDWTPAPVERWALVVDVIPNMLVRGIAPEQMPFHGQDWPASFRETALRAIEQPNLLGTTLAATTAPFALSDWSTVRPKAWTSFDVTPNTLVRGIPSAPTPFSQTQWQVSFGWRFGQEAQNLPMLMQSSFAPEIVVASSTQSVTVYGSFSYSVTVNG